VATHAKISVPTSCGARNGAAQAAHNAHDLGRELFGGMRKNVTGAEQGACTWL